MGLEDVVTSAELAEYNLQQLEHIHARYEKYLAVIQTHVSLTEYVSRIYVPLGYAEKFREEYLTRNLRKSLANFPIK